LIAAVKKFGEKNWQQVAHQLEGRAGQQCLHRWQKTLNPAIQRGRWKPEEDMVNPFGFLHPFFHVNFFISKLAVDFSGQSIRQ